MATRRDGREIFREWIEAAQAADPKLSLEDIGRAVGTGKSSIFNWSSPKSDQRPNARFRKAIATYTRDEVPVDCWETSDELDKLASVEPYEPTGTDGA